MKCIVGAWFGPLRVDYPFGGKGIIVGKVLGLQSRYNKIDRVCFAVEKKYLSLQPQNGTYLHGLCKYVPKNKMYEL